MGKRKKSTRKPQSAAKKAKPLDRSFKCLFCLHPGTIAVRMDSKDHIGRLDCANCGQHFETHITHLSREIDVYTDWVDAADEAAQSQVKTGTGRKRGRDDDDDDIADDDLLRGPRRKAATRADDGDDDADDDSLPDVPGAF